MDCTITHSTTFWCNKPNIIRLWGILVYVIDHNNQWRYNIKWCHDQKKSGKEISNRNRNVRKRHINGALIEDNLIVRKEAYTLKIELGGTWLQNTNNHGKNPEMQSESTNRSNGRNFQTFEKKLGKHRPTLTTSKHGHDIQCSSNSEQDVKYLTPCTATMFNRLMYEWVKDRYRRQFRWAYLLASISWKNLNWCQMTQLDTCCSRAKGNLIKFLDSTPMKKFF